MYREKKWCVLLLAALALAATACTSNDVDESEADSVLEVLTIDNPPVTGEINNGTCSISGTECLTNDNCPDFETCIPPIVAGECVVTEWSATVANKPLNEGGDVTPFNDITVTSVTISYTNPDGSTYAPTRTIPVSATIEAGATAQLTFFPIALGDLAASGVTVYVQLDFNAESVVGNEVETAGLGGEQLVIGTCAPAP